MQLAFAYRSSHEMHGRDGEYVSLAHVIDCVVCV